MAEKAREQGIDMELTDRREFANAPAYTRNQVRPVSYRGRTEHEGTSIAAHARYQAKRSDEINFATSARSIHYAGAAAEIWNDSRSVGRNDRRADAESKAPRSTFQRRSSTERPLKMEASALTHWLWKPSVATPNAM